MSVNELHNLLTDLTHQRKNADIVDSEYQQRLDEIIESLEQQKLYPDSFDQYSALQEQVGELLLNYETEHPVMQSILKGIQQLLNNFKS